MTAKRIRADIFGPDPGPLETLLLSILACFAWAFLDKQDTFALSKSFDPLRAVASEQVWGWGILVLVLLGVFVKLLDRWAQTQPPPLAALTLATRSLAGAMLVVFFWMITLLFRQGANEGLGWRFSLTFTVASLWVMCRLALAAVRKCRFEKRLDKAEARVQRLGDSRRERERIARLRQTSTLEMSTLAREETPCV